LRERPPIPHGRSCILADIAQCVISGADIASTSRSIKGVNANITAIDSQVFGSQVGIGFLPPGRGCSHDQQQVPRQQLASERPLGQRQPDRVQSIHGVIRYRMDLRLDRVTIIAQACNCTNMPPNGPHLAESADNVGLFFFYARNRLKALASRTRCRPQATWPKPAEVA
jgi:hypothetical protein